MSATAPRRRLLLRGHEEDSDDDFGADGAGAEDQAFFAALSAHTAKADHHDLSMRDDGNIEYKETQMDANFFKPKYDPSKPTIIKPSSYTGAIATAIEAVRATSTRARPTQQPSSPDDQKAPKATAYASGPTSKSASASRAHNSDFVTGRAIASAARGGRGGGRGGRGRGNAKRGRAVGSESDRSEPPRAFASGGFKVPEPVAAAAVEAKTAKGKQKKGRASLPDSTNLLSKIGAASSTVAKGKGKKGGAAAIPSAKRKADGDVDAIKAGVSSDDPAIEILPTSPGRSPDPEPAAKAQGKTTVKTKAAKVPAKRGAKRKKDEDEIKFGMLPVDVNTNEAYPLTAAMKRQRTMALRKKQQAEAAEAAEAGPSKLSAAEKGIIAVQQLKNELWPGGKPTKRRKVSQDDEMFSEGGESVVPDEDKHNEKYGDEGEEDQAGRDFILSRFFDPNTPRETSPEPNAIASASPVDIVLTEGAKAPAKSLYDPPNLEQYIANDPIAAGADNSSSILPYSSPIDRKLKRQDSKLHHPHPRASWSRELENLKRIAARKGEEVERREQAERQRKSSSGDEKPDVMDAYTARSPSIKQASRRNWAPSAPVMTSKASQHIVKQPFPNLKPAAETKPAVPPAGEWGTLQNKAKADTVRPRIIGFGYPSMSSSSAITRAEPNSSSSGSGSGGLLSGRTLFKPSRAPTFETALSQRPVFRSRRAAAPLPVPAEENDVFGAYGRAKYDPLQRQMQQEAAFAQQEDVMGYRPTTSRYFGGQSAGGLDSHRPRAFPSNVVGDPPTHVAGRYDVEEDDDGGWEERWKPQSLHHADPSRLGADCFASMDDRYGSSRTIESGPSRAGGMRGTDTTWGGEYPNAYQSGAY